MSVVLQPEMRAGSQPQLEVSSAPGQAVFVYLWLMAFAVRLLFIWKASLLPTDGVIYQAHAITWLKTGIYGLARGGGVWASGIRMPGYPAIIAALYAVFGQHLNTVFLFQAAMDSITCLLVAQMAYMIAPRCRTKVAIAAGMVAVFCPFTAKFTSSLVPDSIATTCTALALYFLVRGISSGGFSLSLGSAFGIGLSTAAATYLRPESPLFVIAIIPVILYYQRLDRISTTLVRVVVLCACVGVPLIPWAVRNYVTLHKYQLLVPRHPYEEMNGRYAPVGYYAWAKTWSWNDAQAGEFIHPTYWGHFVDAHSLPEYAFDNDAEREEVQSLLAAYNATGAISPEADQQFQILADARTHRAPWRTYVGKPFARGINVWFARGFRSTRLQDSKGAKVFGWALFALNIGLLGLAVVGFWIVRTNPFAYFFIALFVSRTMLLVTMDAPETRYTNVLLPAIFVLAGVGVWSLVSQTMADGVQQ